MSIRIQCPFCEQRFELDEFREGVEFDIECPQCGKVFTLEMQPSDAQSGQDAPEQPEKGAKASADGQKEEFPIYEYKVLTEADGFFTHRFDSEELEKAINHYAGQGWRVVSAVTASIPGLLNSRDELLVIMERDENWWKKYNWK